MGFGHFYPQNNISINGTPRSGDLPIECAALDERDRVAVTYPGQTEIGSWVNSGDRYAVPVVSTMQSIERHSYAVPRCRSLKAEL